VRIAHQRGRSWNCGVEGPTDNVAIEQLRNRQVKNVLTLTMLSLGMPMLLMGDEVRRTQRGNNNAYWRPVGSTGACSTNTPTSFGSPACCSHAASCGPRPPSNNIPA
jgi:hypothetical protein